MLRLEIVTPDQKIYSEDVDSVVIPGIEGEFGVLPQHVPLMTQLVPGELRVLKGVEEIRLAVGGGFVEISSDKVAVLTDMAIKESDIDESDAEEGVRRAEAAMLSGKMSDEEHATVKASLQKSLAQIRVKRRRV